MKKIVKEINKMSINEINKEINKIREEILKLKIESKTSPLKDTNLIKKKKKRLAVLLTILTQKKLMS